MGNESGKVALAERLFLTTRDPRIRGISELAFLGTEHAEKKVHPRERGRTLSGTLNRKICLLLMKKEKEHIKCGRAGNFPWKKQSEPFNREVLIREVNIASLSSRAAWSEEG